MSRIELIRGKKKGAIIAMVIYLLTNFIINVADAQCPQQNLVEVTIIKGQSGKVMTRCVHPSAVDQMGGESDYVIPAGCPCDETLLQPATSWDVEETVCRFLDGEGRDSVFIEQMTDPYLYAEAFVGWSSGRTMCDYIGPSLALELFYGLSASEVEACAAHIWAFAVNELGLECSGEFPDFEP